MMDLQFRRYEDYFSILKIMQIRPTAHEAVLYTAQNMIVGVQYMLLHETATGK